MLSEMLRAMQMWTLCRLDTGFVWAVDGGQRSIFASCTAIPMPDVLKYMLVALLAHEAAATGRPSV